MNCESPCGKLAKQFLKFVRSHGQKLLALFCSATTTVSFTVAAFSGCPIRKTSPLLDVI